MDNGSSVNILFGAIFDKMIIDHKLTPVTTPYMASPEIASSLGKNNTCDLNRRITSNEFKLHGILNSR